MSSNYTVKTKRIAAGEYLTTGHAGPSYRIERNEHFSHGQAVTIWAVFEYGSDAPFEAFDTKADAVAWISRYLAPVDERHYIQSMPHGADCSCGRQFSIWGTGNRSAARDAQKLINLRRANARRHADAANAKL